jgi:GT2 family glycosyltransferase
VTSAPTVSVCIPVYNNASTLSRCLDSVLAQDGVDFEVVVVDDDSSDDSVAVATAALDPAHRLVRNSPRLGLVGNHNRCLELARGKYVQFVHADDWLLPGALHTLVGELDEADAGMAWAPRRVVTDDATWLRKYGKLHEKFWRLRHRDAGRWAVTQLALLGIPGNWIGEPTCVMFRRQLALDAGLFRDDIYQLLDLDLWLRLMLRASAVFVPQEQSVRSHTATTATANNRRIRRDWLDHLRVVTSTVVDPAAPPVIRVLGALWWVPIWLKVGLENLVFGPDRYRRFTAWLAAPVREFGTAQRVFEARRAIVDGAGAPLDP